MLLVQRRGVELMLDALEMIEPFDRSVEGGAFLLGQFGFHLRNLVGEPRPIERSNPPLIGGRLS